MAEIKGVSEDIHFIDFIEEMKAANLFYKENLATAEIDETLLAVIPETLAVRYHILPVSRADERLVLVTDTHQTYKDRAEKELGETIKLILTTEENLRAGLLRFYQIKSFKQISGPGRSFVDTTDSPLRSSIVSMLQSAARDGASDIHLLPYSGGIYVRFRIHGHLYDVTDVYNFPETAASNIISLIKQFDDSGNMDQTRTNMPNEGSFSIPLGTDEIFVRMETVPVNGGTDRMEEVALRLLPQSSAKSGARFTLENIGYTEEDLRHIKRMLYKSATGLFINSGPTGAGKTSSLYAQINHLLDAFREPMHVVTIDDPIEIREERFTQVQVRKVDDNEKLALTADKILVSALRLDPDIILYNEIRNATDARSALRASTTGHRVFSTVHAGNCVKTILRLLGLVGAHIDGGKRVETRRHHVGIATLLVELITLLSILCSLVVVRQADMADGKQVETVSLQFRSFVKGQCLSGELHRLLVVLLGICLVGSLIELFPFAVVGKDGQCHQQASYYEKVSFNHHQVQYCLIVPHRHLPITQ